MQGLNVSKAMRLFRCIKVNPKVYSAKRLFTLKFRTWMGTLRT
jgi:hypothetical protein